MCAEASSHLLSRTMSLSNNVSSNFCFRLNLPTYTNSFNLEIWTNQVIGNQKRARQEMLRMVRVVLVILVVNLGFHVKGSTYRGNESDH